MSDQSKRIPRLPISDALGATKPQSYAYYRALYVQRGGDRGGAAERHLHNDVMSAQRDLARRLASATITEVPDDLSAPSPDSPP